LTIADATFASRVGVLEGSVGLGVEHMTPPR
jgi:hypothetical protein